ncbi:hypothetical protein PIB30_090653, partial [Stylosanthes scabra]|nr:hypothetical protein [Stylosanthes scabra]
MEDFGTSYGGSRELDIRTFHNNIEQKERGKKEENGASKGRLPPPSSMGIEGDEEGDRRVRREQRGLRELLRCRRAQEAVITGLWSPPLKGSHHHAS